MRYWICCAFALLTATASIAQIDPAILRPVAYHPQIVSYFNAPYFANALAQGGEWYSFTGTEFGSPIDYNTAQFNNVLQFDKGYPKFLQPNQRLRAFLFGLNINYGFRPNAWPPRDTLAKGRIVVTWEGNADIRLVSGTFVATGSSGAETGSLLNGRRIYLCTEPFQSTQTLEVHEILAPLTEIRVWLAPPDDPATPGTNENLTLSLEGQLFHPLLLQRIADADFGFIRFMDWGATNSSPQQDWIDRRLPTHIFENGILNARSPAPGSPGNRETGVAFEHMVALCNATGRNMWINVPHLATADFITRLAKLIRFGSDGVNPYDGPQSDPKFAPLRSDLKVYVEFSNEIWSSGFAFAQGDWAQDQADHFLPNAISKPQFTARKFCDTWRIFQEVFGGTDRLVRVAAIFTALDSYSRPFLQEIADYGVTLSPPVRPDVMAVTTYFGNDIQGFVDQQGFTAGKLFDDPYWTSPLFETHLQTAFNEWKRRILSGDAASGSGPDATGIGGGFSSSLRTLPNETLGYSLPIVAYEGGPSLFTDNIDGGAENGSGVPTDDGVTTFIEAMNRDPRVADVYRIHLEIAKSKGLWTHTPYADTSNWGKFGQWGHLETLDAPPATQPKYALLLEHFATFSALRHIDQPLNAVPQFSTPATLPPGIVDLFYAADIATSGGDGARTVTVIGTFLDPGLTVAPGLSPGTLRVSGTPTSSGKSFVFARVQDADGDPSWRIFTLETFGGAGTLVQSDFRGTSPALNRPWTPTLILSPKVTWSGWDVGAGALPHAGDDAFVFNVSGGQAANETLTQAIADNEYLTATVTPAQGPIDLRGSEIRFSIRRIDFHSPLGYALFTSASGFSEANALYISSQLDKGDFGETQHIVTIPSTAAFASINAPLEIRIVAFGAQFDGHNTSLTAFKLTQLSPGPQPPTPSNFSATAPSTTQVTLTWNAVAGASGYEVTRRFNGGSEQIIGTPTAASFTDNGVVAGTAYLYRVRAIAAGGTSLFSTSDLATTFVFTNDPIAINQTTIQSAHLTDVRDAANAVRILAALAPASWTDDPLVSLTTKIRAAHITEVRAALTQALTALGLTATFSDPSLAIGDVIRKNHVQQIRDAMK
ncbi:MAG: fibronectin type III domain-containing protein [Thermoanaerobaculia bacterium]